MIWNDLDLKNIWHPFTPWQSPTPLFIESANGVYLHTADGRKIIDGISSWWVTLHGHAHPTIAKAIAEQAAKLEQVIFAGFTHEPAITLATNLLKLLTDKEKIFFSDNGSTAVEVAIKLALQYWKNKGLNKTKIIALQGAYHGDTFGAMSVGERSLFTRPFQELLFSVEHIPLPTENSMEGSEKVFSEEVAAIIYEPLVQGADGMKMYSPKGLERILELAKKKNILTIADEVFTGFFRTGKFIAGDYITPSPDLMALSKGITGGFLPLGVTACSSKIVEAFRHTDFEKTFFHGHSYTANPLACAAANASLKLLFEKECQENIAMITKMHSDFVLQIGHHSKVKEVRSLGTIFALEIKTEGGYSAAIRNTIYQYFLDRDILLRPLGNIIYVLPPYCIAKEELEKIYRAIEDFLNSKLF